MHPASSPDDYLADLTDAQREAVLHTDGPLLILAGPGSGKTRVITRRIAHLIHQGVKPYQILAITFTNKAAREMRQRVEAIMPGKGVWLSTFHSLGVRLLRHLRRSARAGTQLHHLRPGRPGPHDQGRPGSRQHRQCSLHSGSHPGRHQQGQEPAPDAGQVRRPRPTIFSARSSPRSTRSTKRGCGPPTPSTSTICCFGPPWPSKTIKNLRAELDARFRYVLVDEYQDTNKAQYAIARGLSQDYPNLCVVGDPDQSIYKWRGADIRNILDFERDFPNARVITLSENFRSTKTILQVADASDRQQQTAQAQNADHRPTRPAGRCRCWSTRRLWTKPSRSSSRIRADVAEGKRHYRDFALFLRINALSRNLESAFIRARVPYQIVRGLAFFDRKENKDILAYLRLLLNPRDDVSFLPGGQRTGPRHRQGVARSSPGLCRAA